MITDIKRRTELLNMLMNFCIMGFVLAIYYGKSTTIERAGM